MNSGNYINLKIPIDNTNTNFQWKKVQKKVIKKQILDLSIQQIKKLQFQQKFAWFYNKLQQKRIPWQQGAQIIRIQSDNVLMSSIQQIKKANLHKQLKVQILGDKVNDAGGLLRQWVFMIINQIFDFNTGIFTFTDTEDTMYKLKWDRQMDQFFSSQLLQLLGIIIGKSIFQSISLPCYLDRTILRQISRNKVQLQDIYGYDKEFLELYFVTYHNNGGEVQQIQLLQGHRQIQMIINGLPYIDIQNWHDNTKYKQYKQNDQVILWFWNWMQQQDQSKLARMLKFTTGTTRPPLGGFQSLPSNRGELSPFTIVKVPYQKQKPFPRSYTCFNRLQLPNYPSQQIFKQSIQAILNDILDGIFGLD